MRQTVLVIAGPTASGKSGLALDVAGQHNGVIINADSMQVYDGLPLLTAQPSPDDLAKAPHRLYGVLHPNDGCSATRWRDMALAEMEKARLEGKLPILTGGTGFYLKTLMEGISPIPEVPLEIRERLSARQKEIGTSALHAELAKADPETAAKLDPFNSQRVIRAMEVLEHTGTGLSKWQAIPRDKPAAHLHFKLATLLPPREVLYRHCDMRFAKMMENGALEEAEDFLAKIKSGAVSSTAPLAKALGFPELAAFIEGKTTREEAIEAAAMSTRRYAKRQVTWFRNQMKADMVLEIPHPGLIKLE